MMRKLWRDGMAQMGWQGVSGIVLLGVVGALHLLVITPLEGQTARMQARMDAEQSGNGGQWSGARNELGKFYQDMPGEKDVTDVMASIYAAADASEVQLEDASFHLENGEGPVIGYVMDFPMAGRYAGIRMLVSRVLTRNPYMALDQIDFRRDQISDADLRADVRFTLFLRKNSGR